MGGDLKQGDLIHLNWSPQSGSEMAHKHYGVIFSVEQFNKLIQRIVVAPITSKKHAEFGSLRVPVQSEREKISGFICLDHIRCLDPDTRNCTLINDELTVHCRTRCKEVLQKIFKI